jgi:cardiolipin synthase A/B
VRRRRLRLALAAVVVVGAVLALRGIGGGTPSVRAMLPAREPAGAVADTVIVEPDDSMAPIYALLAAPRRTLDMTVYELVDPTAESVLADDAARGVRVRVILDGRLERGRNAAAYEFLRSRGVEVVWSSERYFVTHEKTFVIDGSVAVVMSLNLASRYYATTRDVAVVDRDPRDATAIEAVFDADLRGAPTGTPAADDLVWSPGQSQADLVTLIDSARRSISVESEELSSRTIVAAMVAAARRGVTVSVAMTYDPGYVPGFNAITRAGGVVSLMQRESPLYIHAKLLAVDTGMPDARGFVGSENLSDASLLHDRELGIVLTSPRLVGEVGAVIAGDVRDGRRWR